MKTEFLKILLLVPALLLCSNIQAQDEEIEVPEDIDFLNPHDHLGNKWFAEVQDRRDFFNALVTAAKSDPDRPMISIKEDLFIGSVRSDEDYVADSYDYAYYYNLFIFKSDTQTEVFDDLERTEELIHKYDLKFYLGSNITNAEYVFVEDELDIFSYNLYTVNLSAILTEPFLNEETDRDAWLNGHPGDLFGLMRSLTLSGN